MHVRISRVAVKVGLPRSYVACGTSALPPPPSLISNIRLAGASMGLRFRWAKSQDSYRRIASETYRYDSNH